MSQNDLVDIKTIAAKLGIHHTTVRRLIRDEAAPHLRIKKRVYVPADEFLSWHAQYISVRAQAGPRKKRTTTAAQRSAIPCDRNFVLWNRGDWRGWAVAHADKVDDEFLWMLVDYADRTLACATSRFRQDVARGEVFIVEPDNVLEFVSIQLSRFKDEAPRRAIALLQEAAKELRRWRAEREEEEETDDTP